LGDQILTSNFPQKKTIFINGEKIGLIWQITFLRENNKQIVGETLEEGQIRALFKNALVV